MCYLDDLFQFENLAGLLKLPGKKTFNNMDKDFLEKRKNDLNAYLQVVILQSFPSLDDLWSVCAPQYYQ